MPTSVAAVDHADAVGEGQDLVELGRHQQHGGALSRISMIRRWMNSIEPTSRPRVGWATTSSFTVAGELAGDDHLLLVAAREVVRRRPLALGRADVELARPASSAWRSMAPVVAQPSAANGACRYRFSTRLSAIVNGPDEPVLAAILGHVPDAELDDLARGWRR